MSGRALPTGRGASGPFAVLEDAQAAKSARVAVVSSRGFRVRLDLMAEV
jgi:hypothetical protein